MPDPSVTPRRAAAVVGLSALALSLTGSPAFALDSPLPQLDTVTGTATTAALDPVTDLLSPSPSPSPSPEPLPVPVPEPLRPVVDPVVEAITGSGGDEPVGGQGGQPAPVAAPGGSAPQPAAAPQVAARSGVGSTSLGSFGAFRNGLQAGLGTAGVPALGAPMIASAPSFALPGLPEPMTAPVTEIAAPRSNPLPAAPAGLPALVVAVAAVAVIAAGAGHAAELRVRRSPDTD